MGNKCGSDSKVFYKSKDQIIFEKDKAIDIQYCKDVAKIAKRNDDTLDIYEGYFVIKDENKNIYQSTKHYFNVKDNKVHEFKKFMGKEIEKSSFICYIGSKYNVK